MAKHVDFRPSIRSPRFDNLRGAKLSDARIRHYILAGYYGPERKARELAAIEAEKLTRKLRARDKAKLKRALQHREAVFIPSDLDLALKLLT